MAGLYIHIPFCKKACNYCDFHFSTQLNKKSQLVQSILTELEIRKDYLQGDPIQTIYFGGGTPSLLSEYELSKIFEVIYQNFPVSDNAEITFEANPDDLELNKIQALKYTPINRFSIGVQSFFEEDLIWMNRSHNAYQAISGIKNLQKEGYENISLDLIFGYPLLSLEKWRKNLNQAIQLGIPHISTYGMTVEKGTLLETQIRKGISTEMDEDGYISHFKLLIELLENDDYQHYEISNFAKPDFQSRHNSNYWNQIQYLGIGPSAHSYSGDTRSWNISNNAKYIDSLNKGIMPSVFETLSPEQKLHEYILTKIRTSIGCDLTHINAEFGANAYHNLLKKATSPSLTELIYLQNKHLILTSSGKLLCEYVLASII